ncbi:MAG TPA: ABC transporter permease [Burkholderiales bacterium]|jgi:lipopolysaccharide transport system permease protein|nr:ABC transporter permease [Burkholderiales bacterium]
MKMKPDRGIEGAMRVYSAAPALLAPGVLLRDMVRDFKLSIALGWQLAARDLKAQYRQSLLGYLWALLPPLLVAASFIALKAGGVFSAESIGVPYGVYVIIGTLLWQIFADAVVAPLRLVIASREMLVRVNFPREAIVLAGLFVTFFGALVRLAVAVPILVYYQVEPTLDLLYVPFGVLSLILAGTCVGLLVTPVGVLYRDVEKALPALLMLWLLLTPVAYPIATAAGEPGWLAFNFASPLLEAARSALIGGAPIAWSTLAVVNGAVLLALLAGWLLLRLAAPHLVARLGI